MLQEIFERKCGRILLQGFFILFFHKILFSSEMGKYFEFRKQWFQFQLNATFEGIVLRLNRGNLS